MAPLREKRKRARAPRARFPPSRPRPGTHGWEHNGRPQASIYDNTRKAFMYSTNFRISKKYNLFRNRPVDQKRPEETREEYGGVAAKRFPAPIPILTKKI